MLPTTAIILLSSLQIASVASLVLDKADDVLSARLTAKLHGGGDGRRSARGDLSGRSRRRRQAAEGDAYSSPTWSGAVAGDGERKFESVSANIVVPGATFPYGFNSSETYEASAWVGIGGTFTEDTSLLQTGFYYTWTTDGANKGMYAFYEWYPEPVQWYNVSDIQAGDRLHVRVRQDASRTAGTVTYENLSRDPAEAAAADVRAPGGVPTDGLSADWIVESWLADGRTVPPSWGTLEFTDVEAVFEGGAVADLADPGLFAWPMDGIPFAGRGNDTVVFPGAIDVQARTARSTWRPWM